MCVCCAAGYVGVSDLEEVVYRTEGSPGLGFLLKRSFYDDHMAKHMDECCMKRYVCSYTCACRLVFIATLARTTCRPTRGRKSVLSRCKNGNLCSLTQTSAMRF